VAAAVGATALLAAGCSRAGTSTTSASSSSPSSSSSGASTAGDFGTLTNVCHGGSPSGAPAQGVTATTIKVGVLTDEQFNKNPDLPNAATVFSKWCNAAGGINGRQIVPDVHQTDMMAVVPAMTAACSSDFVLAGGSAALDGLGTATRLKCLLPDFDAQENMPQAAGSDLEFGAVSYNFAYADYSGYYKWLMQKYPDSKGHIAIVWGDSAVTQIDYAEQQVTIAALGGGATTSITFPATGVTNWTPYAEEIKAKGIKGLTFYGTPEWLIPLEQALDNIGYKLDWIDTNSNAYGASFIQLAGKILSQQTNYASLFGVYPLEKASGNPTVQKIQQLFQQYAPGQPVTLQVLQAFSMWLAFATAAENCGSNLTRTCVVQSAQKLTTWNGGGITATENLGTPLAPMSCFNVEQASTSGWAPATGFTPNTDGVYSCGMPQIKLPSSFPAPLNLASVGQSMANLK
jgi:hypothetical protein